MIEHFTAQEFQAALPSGWVCTGYEYSELTYLLPTIGPVKILVRSTIRQDGQSAGTGEDSIRCFLVLDSGAPLGFNLIHYTTRVSGWQSRLAKVIETLQSFRRVSGDCPRCHIPKSIFLSNTARNPHRYFAKCGRCSNNFVWLDAPTSQPYYHQIPVSDIVPLSRSTDVPKLNPINERTSEGRSVERGGGIGHSDTDVSAGVAVTQPVSSPQDGNRIPLSDRTNPPLLQGDMVAPIAGPLSFLSKMPSAVHLVTDVGEANVAPADNASPFIASKYQSAIYNFLQSGSGNGVVIATAGSGKTSTIRNATPYLPKGAKVAAIAFNRRNALDLQRVMPEWVRASTFHSLGLGNVKRSMPNIKVDGDKVWRILHQMADTVGRSNPEVESTIASDGAAIHQIVGLIKSTLALATPESVTEICDHYGIVIETPWPDIVAEVVETVLNISNDNTDTADFGDMLMWCSIGRVPCERFDFILQDEAQDATQAQIEFVKRSLKPSGRLLAVGDPRQAIYSWAGSAIDSIDQLVRYHHAGTLPLSISYRLPVSHVEHVNGKFPGANIEPRPNAPVGVIGNKSYPEMISRLVDGDLVMCRVNAPLIEPCFELIRQGRKATIAGRDIGKGLTVLLTKMEKRNSGASISQLMTALVMYAERECDKLVRSRKANQAATLRDQVDTLVALSDGVHSTSEIRHKVAAVFSDDIKGVTFSSVHRAKGAEANSVYLYKPELIPHPMSAGSDWQLAAEQNVLFVALTRSKLGLYFVSGE